MTRFLEHAGNLSLPLQQDYNSLVSPVEGIEPESPYSSAELKQRTVSLKALRMDLAENPLPFTWTNPEEQIQANGRGDRLSRVIGIVGIALVASAAVLVLVQETQKPALFNPYAAIADVPKNVPSTSELLSTSPTSVTLQDLTSSSAKPSSELTPSSVKQTASTKTTSKSKATAAPRPANTKEKAPQNPNIQLGIPMSAPQRLIVRNPDGTILINVTTEPYAGDSLGTAPNGMPLYSYDPPVAQSPGDERANYLHRPDASKQGGGAWPGFMGEPNTLPVASKKGVLAPKDDNIIFMSHSTNYQNDPSRWMAFQLLKDAKVGATAEVVTGNADYLYKLKTPVREILKIIMPNDTGTWEPIKNTIVLVTCEAAIQPDGTRIPADKEQNITSRWEMIAAKATTPGN